MPEPRPNPVLAAVQFFLHIRQIITLISSFRFLHSRDQRSLSFFGLLHSCTHLSSSDLLSFSQPSQLFFGLPRGDPSPYATSLIDFVIYLECQDRLRGIPPTQPLVRRPQLPLFLFPPLRNSSIFRAAYLVSFGSRLSRVMSLSETPSSFQLKAFFLPFSTTPNGLKQSQNTKVREPTTQKI